MATDKPQGLFHSASEDPTSSTAHHNRAVAFFSPIVKELNPATASIAVVTAFSQNHPGFMHKKLLEAHIFTMLFLYPNALVTASIAHHSRPTATAASQTPQRFILRPVSTAAQTEGITMESRFAQTPHPFQGVNVASAANLRPASRNAAVNAVPVSSSASSSTVHTPTMDKQL